MTSSRKVFYARRFTLEAQSPLAISSGANDPLLDNQLARDANGMPMIPASTLAGALRALVYNTETADAIFGYQRDATGQRSTVTFTDALVHWPDNKPRDGWANLPEEDAVVSTLAHDSPIMRQHVRLNAFGVTEGAGKFERSAVPAGARFTFEVSCWDGEESLKQISAMIRNGVFLGGAKRSGYGALSCIAEGNLSIPLTKEAASAFKDYANASLSEADIFHMSPVRESQRIDNSWIVEGSIEGTLLIGAPRSDGQGGRQPYSEARITWDGDNASLGTTDVVLSGSAIKGPLRHRTLFHLKRLGKGNPDTIVDVLFGCAANDGSGQAGLLRFHDATVTGGHPLEVPHVSLDRFTGGARDKSGALFHDHMTWQPSLRMRIDCLGDVPETGCEAFAVALEDLKTGMLGIGAEWGEGAGVFGTCEITQPSSMGKYE